MKIVDMHCDTIYGLLQGRRGGLAQELSDNTLHIDIKKMQQADYLLQNFALFVGQDECEDPYEEAKAEYAVFKEEIKKNQTTIRQVFSYDDIEKCKKDGKMAALLTIEEGEIFQSDIKKLDEFYAYGVRMAALVWNFDNSLSTSALHRTPPTERRYRGSREGLTETGIEFVQHMESIGMIPDVSHMSDAAIRDLLQIAKKPFVASHSNARGLCAHPRNLSDEFLKSMGNRGCVIGTNFYSAFLKEGAQETKNAWIAEHILYMTDKAGIESVGFGTDFDGIECGLEMKDCSNMQQLAAILRKKGMSENDMEKIFGGNVLRLYKELL